MSGVTAATIIAGVTAAAAVGSTAFGVVQGNRQADAQDKALKAQKTAQGEAKAAALSTQRKADLANNEANMKTPDIASILAKAADASKAGLSSTMLTGPSGVNTSSLNLGKSTLLGG